MVFSTVLAGVLTFVLAQVLMKFVIEPVQDFKKTIADISHAFIEHAQVCSNPELAPDEDARRVSDVFRLLSSRVNAHLYLIPKYEWTRRLFGLPTKKAVADASTHLIGLSNSVFKTTADRLGKYNDAKVQKVCDLLNIYVPEQWRL